jgi:TRAP-type C4-dicarboxylate transport system permease small subunit
MIGSGLTIRVDGHVGVDILLTSIKDNKKRFYLYAISRSIAIAFLLMFFPASIQLILMSTLSRASSIPLPYTVVYLAVPIGILNMLLSYASALPKFALRYKRGEA